MRLAATLKEARIAGQLRRRRISVTLNWIAFAVIVGAALIVVAMSASGSAAAGALAGAGSAVPLGGGAFLMATSPLSTRKVYIFHAVYALVSVVLGSSMIVTVRDIEAEFEAGHDTTTMQSWDPAAPPEWVVAYTTARRCLYYGTAAAFVPPIAITLSALRPGAGCQGFAVRPRPALRRACTAIRLWCLMTAIVLASVTIVASAVNPAYRTFLLMPLNLMLCALWLTFSLCFTPQRRGRIVCYLGSLAHKNEVSAAAAVAAMVGGKEPEATLARAASTFRGLPFPSLTKDDMTSSLDSGLNARTRSCALGSVDMFMSHSWRDSIDHKWDALAAYAARHQLQRQKPLVMWLDKGCIDQRSIDESLHCLPVHLAGCQKLVCFCGATYTYRLWCVRVREGSNYGLRTTLIAIASGPAPAARRCAPPAPADASLPLERRQVMELFTFLAAGCSIERVEAVPIAEKGDIDTPPEVLRQAALARVRAFAVGGASCYHAHEKHHLLGVIEASFGRHDEFNRLVRRQLTSTLLECDLEASIPSRPSRKRATSISGVAVTVASELSLSALSERFRHQPG